MKTKTEIPWATIDEQKQYWKDKEAASNNATNETRRAYIEGDGSKMQLYVRSMGKLLAVTALFDSDDKANDYCEIHRDERVVATTGNLVFLANLYDHGTPAELSVSGRTKVYLVCPQSDRLTAADPKPETGLTLDQTEATCDWYDNERTDFDRGDLRDDGRSDGYGMSY